MKSSAEREACGDQRRERGITENSQLSGEAQRGTGYVEGLDPYGNLQPLSCAVAGLSHGVASLRFRKGEQLGSPGDWLGCSEWVMKGQRGKGFGE